MKILNIAVLIAILLPFNILLSDNHSDQMNPNNDAYWDSRGYDGRPDDWEDRTYGDSYGYSQDDYDNRSNQLNPNNDAYWQSRGYDERPDDWENRTYGSGYKYSRDDYNNRSNQLNPNNDAFWQSRGFESRPENWNSSSLDQIDWKELAEIEEDYPFIKFFRKDKDYEDFEQGLNLILRCLSVR